MTIRRHLIPRVVLVAAFLGLSALSPTGGGTSARWSDADAVRLPAMTNDSIGVSARAAPTETQLPGASTVTVKNDSSRLDGILQVEGTATPAGWDSGLASTVDTTYAECGSGTSAQGLHVSPGGQRTLCVVIDSTTKGTSLLLHHAGATVDVTTTVSQQAATTAAWSSTATATTRHTVPFPSPTHPGATRTKDAVCTGSLIGPATLRWAWPDSEGRNATASPAVSSWAIQRWGDAGWQTVVSGIPGSARSAQVSTASLLGLNTGEWFRVVAHPTAGGGGPRPATFEVRLVTVLSLGIAVGVSCADVQDAR